MRSTIAKTLFENAIESVRNNKTMWHTPNECHAMLCACEEASGIPYYFLNLAVKEFVTQTMLQNLFDICSRDLAMNLTGKQHYVRGEKPTESRPHSIGQAMYDVVNRRIIDITYMTDLPKTHEARQAAWYEYLDKNMHRIEEAYLPEACDMFRAYIASSKAENGGAA